MHTRLHSGRSRIYPLYYDFIVSSSHIHPNSVRYIVQHRYGLELILLSNLILKIEMDIWCVTAKVLTGNLYIYYNCTILVLLNLTCMNWHTSCLLWEVKVGSTNIYTVYLILGSLYFPRIINHFWATDIDI